MNKYQTIGFLYRNVVKPGLFLMDAELVHDLMTKVGESIENLGIFSIFSYKSENLKRNFLGINFPNPVGLAAGFDYDGHLAKVIGDVGFGWNTVGTVTAKPYGGNFKPRLGRLPKSKSLLVNKGFKSEGAVKIAERLDGKKLDGHVVGISVGSSNLPEINTISKAIDDYLFTFNLFKNKEYVKYFELNISCPNTEIKESFGAAKNYEQLVGAVRKLKIKQPIFLKIASESENSDELVKISLKHDVRGFIFSNLVKDRKNQAFDRDEIEKISNLKGNFSGKPAKENSLRLISQTRKKFGKDVVLVGLGGIFNAEDAIERMAAGADLVQLITGMIYQGPQLAGEICNGLSEHSIMKS